MKWKMKSIYERVPNRCFQPFQKDELLLLLRFLENLKLGWRPMVPGGVGGKMSTWEVL